MGYSYSRSSSKSDTYDRDTSKSRSSSKSDTYVRSTGKSRSSSKSDSYVRTSSKSRSSSKYDTYRDSSKYGSSSRRRSSSKYDTYDDEPETISVTESKKPVNVKDLSLDELFELRRQLADELERRANGFLGDSDPLIKKKKFDEWK
jgi:hypothetical protein